MKEKEMRYIAGLIAEVYNYSNDKSIEDNKINKLKDEVSSFISQYQSIHYSLDNVIAGLSI
jgi:glycine/serine hydroxymethyltransferase